MSNHISVIESDDYREEEEILKADPVIIEMVEEVIESGPMAVLLLCADNNTSMFMASCNDEYHKRGGTQARSIGGPLRAVRSLLGVESSE